VLLAKCPSDDNMSKANDLRELPILTSGAEAAVWLRFVSARCAGHSPIKD
jgi:hypothetical protein